MKILIVGDEEKLLKILKKYFEVEGFSVETALDGEEAIYKIDENKIDLVILDWMIPKISGIEVCKYIKENTNAKVLMLTARTQFDDELEALNIGADEYVKKPFDIRVLVMRGKKLLNLDKNFRFKNIDINFESQKVYRDGENLNLTKIEFELLKCFVKNKGIILSRGKIIDLVWGLDYDGDPRTVDTHIRRLRRKIGEDVVKTYRGIGYSLEGEIN